MNIMYISREPLDAAHGAGKAIFTSLRDISNLGHTCILSGLSSLEFIEDHENQPNCRQWRGVFPVWLFREGNIEYLIHRPGRLSRLVIAILMFAAKRLGKLDQLRTRFLRLFFSRVIAAERRRRQLDVILTDGHPGPVLAVKDCDLPKLSVLQVPVFVPFGPCASPDQPGYLLDAYRDLAGFITYGEYPKKLIEEGIGSKVFTVPFPSSMFGAPTPYDNATTGHVVMINPCSLKGIDIFLALARDLPDVSFAAVPSWGTSAEDLERIKKSANVAVIPFQKDLEVLYRQTRVLIVPSLWPEFFGLVVIEAMLRGIPVIASDHAGLRDSKLNVDYLVPVNPITFSRGVQYIEVPPQNIGPWKDALRRLLTDPDHYRKVSADSLEAATAYLQRAATAAYDFEAVLRTTTQLLPERMRSKQSRHCLDNSRNQKRP